VYNLDVETMRKIMRTHKKTGYLRADLLSGIPSLRQPCQVEIVLKAGDIVSCSIISNRRQLLTGDKAYQELTRLGQLDWNFVPQLPPAVSSEPAALPAEKKIIAYPRRIAIVDQWQMRSWHLMHKQVYGLADGKRSVAEIADLLSTTPETIEAILRDLRSVRVIALE
jgi:hypothetical protein